MGKWREKGEQEELKLSSNSGASEIGVHMFEHISKIQ